MCHYHTFNQWNKQLVERKECHVGVETNKSTVQSVLPVLEHCDRNKRILLTVFVSLFQVTTALLLQNTGLTVMVPVCPSLRAEGAEEDGLWGRASGCS